MRRAIPALAAALLSACGGGGSPSGPSSPPPPAGPQITVTGTATFEDRLYDRDGFTGQLARKPARFVAVQLVADDGGAVLGETFTREDGSYSLTAPITEGRTVHVSLVARITQPLSIEVINVTLQTYALSAPSFAGAARSFSQDFAATTADLGGVFNIVDTMIEGAAAARAANPQNPFGRVRVIWSVNNRARASFNENNNTIQLRGHPEDPDEYDDPVILHEFGHFVARFFSHDTSPGGPHSPFDAEPEVPSLAWSEGFATWFALETRQDPTYFDSFGTGTFAMELETPELARLLVGPQNELAISAVLWDIGDPANEPHDALDRRQAQMWDVMNGHFRATRPADVTMATFCSGWVARAHGQLAELQAVAQHRGISCP
jgi:hypothetical protein